MGKNRHSRPGRGARRAGPDMRAVALLVAGAAALVAAGLSHSPDGAFPEWVPAAHGYGKVVTEGAGAIGSDLVNAAGYTGKGIKVAVIDAGFDPASPEISGRIAESRSFDTTRGIAGLDADHGTAVAEIIADVAPGADLYLYNVSTEMEFYDAADYIIGRGDIDIVSMSLNWHNDLGPADGRTTWMAQKVNYAENSGILWVNTAGNDGQHHWQGRFSDPDGNGTHDFAGSDETLDVSVGAGEVLTVTLSWWGSPSQDYELALYDGSQNLLARSDWFQPGYDPFEQVAHAFQHDATAHIVIKKVTATEDVDFQLFASHDLGEYAVPASSIAIPADSPGAMAVGAFDWGSGTLEGYSSRGPTMDGRIKPDISGPTQVSTAAFGGGAFGGTSAAAPHVAGAAALVMEKYPDATTGQVRFLLESTVDPRHARSNLDGTGNLDVSALAPADILVLDARNAGCDTCVFPASVDALAGDAVTWTNVDTGPVVLESDSSSRDHFTTGTLARGSSFSQTFVEEGIYGYHETTNVWAGGQVIVRAGSSGAELSSARITGPNQVTAVFSGAVEAGPEDFEGVSIAGEATARAFDGLGGSGTDTITLEFKGPPVPADATGTLSVGDGIRGLDGSPVRGPFSAPVADGQAPSLTSVSIASSNPVPGNAVPGDAVTLTFTASERIAGVAATINGNAYAPANTSGNTWSATRTIDGTDAAGPVTFSIDFGDAAGNAGSRVTSTTDGSGASVGGATTSIRGTVFADADGDGSRDPGEPPFPGYTMIAVDLLTGVVRTAESGPDGTYAFDGVSPAPDVTLVQTYYFPFDHTLTTGNFYAYLSPAQGRSATWDVGFRQVLPSEAVTLSVTAYRDDDGDGSRDPGEPPFPGVTVHTYTYTTAELEAVVTGPGGAATKADLVPADWLAQVVRPEGYVETAPDDPATGVIGTLLVIAPEPGSSHSMEIGLAPAP